MFSKKFVHCVVLAVVFFVISSPITYRLVDKLVGRVVGGFSPYMVETLRVAQAGCPTTYGFGLHAVLFGAVAYFFLHR